MKFTMHRDRTIASVMGHAIEFKKGVATHVPPTMYKEVMEAGAEPEEDLELPAELTAGERLALIKAAMEEIVKRDNREDFTAAGVPHTTAVAAVCGYTISAKERDRVWATLAGGDDD